MRTDANALHFAMCPFVRHRWRSCARWSVEIDSLTGSMGVNDSSFVENHSEPAVRKHHRRLDRLKIKEINVIP